MKKQDHFSSQSNPPSVSKFLSQNFTRFVHAVQIFYTFFLSSCGIIYQIPGLIKSKFKARKAGRRMMQTPRDDKSYLLQSILSSYIQTKRAANWPPV